MHCSVNCPANIGRSLAVAEDGEYHLAVCDETTQPAIGAAAPAEAECSVIQAVIGSALDHEAAYVRSVADSIAWRWRQHPL